MIVKLILLLVLIVLSQNKCDNVSSCFIKQLFDFSFPVQNVYKIQLSNQEGSLENVILGYGDFNSDLRSDYVAVDPSTNNLLVFYYQDGGENNGQYLLGATLEPFGGCVPLNIYMYDANLDGQLDITVWGQYSNNSNCIYPLLQSTNNTFTPSIDSPFEYMQTTQPILFESSFVLPGIKTTCFMLFDSQSLSRTIIYYDLSTYVSVLWKKLFNGNDNVAVPFSDQHWNSFIDITDDCNPDIIITNSNMEIQFWVFTSSIGFNLIKIVDVNQLGITSLTSLVFVDVDYDGLQELTLANQTAFFIYPNIQTVPDEICVPFKTSFSFGWDQPLIVNAPANCTLFQQNSHYADLNIDGYPDLAFICKNSAQKLQLYVYENMLSKSQGNFVNFDTYQNPFNLFINNVPQFNATRVSFFDVLQNGIIDIMVTVNNKQTMVLYNNYLYQNYFYIKGFATNGQNTEGGTQIPGASFYWLNSLGNSQKRAVYAQLAQTAYGAVPMPYVLTGLGMANNYVEQFTVGRLGTSKSWSPIIPNSQLAVFSGGQKSSTWNIKIFILPTDSIVYVLIVCIVILTIMGLVLLALKCRHKKEENVLLQDYM